jgi:hypothetical protein
LGAGLELSGQDRAAERVCVGVAGQRVWALCAQLWGVVLRLRV